MPDDIVARLRLYANAYIDDKLASVFRLDLHAAADEIERLHRDYSCICSEMRRMMEERDSARLQTRRILNEIDCRIEHGAESNGHLEAIYSMFKENTDD
jgi:hypothetical protein